MSFLPISSSLSKELTTGFCVSNVLKQDKTSPTGFFLQKTFFDIGSSFRIKLALFSLSYVIKRLISSCIPLAKLRVAKRYLSSLWLVFLPSKSELTVLSTLFARFR